MQYINPAVEEILGVPPEAVLANPDNAMRYVHDDDRARVLWALSSDTEEQIDARVVRPDGEQRWIEFRNFALRDQENRVVAICGTIRDITTRLRAQAALAASEQYIRALLEAIPDTVLRVDSAGVVLDYVAGEVLRDLLSDNGRVIGKSIMNLLPSQFANPARGLIHAALRSGKLQHFEFEVKLGSESRYFEARSLPFGEDEVLLILRDFTAMKWQQGEEERRRFRDELDTKVERRIRSNPYGLTYRELAILHLVAEGSADKQIAESLGVSTYTVNKHVGNILGKMNAASRTEAGVRAIREGLLG
jgi:PAS domain S-box-containing protein